MNLKKTNKRQKAVGEARDVLDAIGHENEKEGIKWTQYFMTLFEKKEWEKNLLDQEKLKTRRHSKKFYIESVLGLLTEQLYKLDRPNYGYSIKTGIDNDKVWLTLYTRFGTTWSGGFKPCGTPKLDVHAIAMFLMAVDDKMIELEEANRTQTGVYLK